MEDQVAICVAWIYKRLTSGERLTLELGAHERGERAGDGALETEDGGVK